MELPGAQGEDRPTTIDYEIRYTSRSEGHVPLVCRIVKCPERATFPQRVCTLTHQLKRNSFFGFSDHLP